MKNNFNENILADAVVNRQIQTQTTVPDGGGEYETYGLPFYYFLDFRFCILLIVLGVIAGIAQFMFMGGLFVLPFLKKKNEFRCIKCKSFFEQNKKPDVCPYCGGEVIPEKEYIKNQNVYNKLYTNRDY